MKPEKKISFGEYISGLLPELVYKHLIKDSSAGRRIVSSATVRHLGEQFSSPESLAERFLSLPDDLKFVCALAYLHGDQGIPAERIGSFDQNRLLRSFLVWAARDENGASYYVGFDEFEEGLRPLLAETIAGNARAELGCFGPTRLPWFCLNDLIMIAGLAAQGQLRRTKGGTLTKTSSMALERLLHLARPDISGGTAESASLLLEFGMDQGFLTFKDSAYSLFHTPLLKWLERPLSEQYREFVEFTAHFTGSWRYSLLLASVPEPGNPWLSARALSRNADETETVDLLRAFAYVGAITICSTENDVLVTCPPEQYYPWKGDDASIPESNIIVMPDFSAILPQESLPSDLYWFMRLGTIGSLDKVYKGKISRKIIHESLCQGIAGSILLECLSKWQAPHNIVATVAEWIREFSRVSVVSDTFLISTEQRVSSELGSYEPLKQYLEPLPAHQVYRIRPGSESKVEEILFSLGFDPRTSKEPVPPRSRIPRHRDQTHVFRRPVTRFAGVSAEKDSDVTLKSGKYSSEMKELDFNEMLHVIDYALLMGYQLHFEYRGTPGVKKGTYHVVPHSLERGTAPMLVAELADSTMTRTFLVKEIAKLGVDQE